MNSHADGLNQSDPPDANQRCWLNWYFTWWESVTLLIPCIFWPPHILNGLSTTVRMFGSLFPLARTI